MKQLSTLLLLVSVTTACREPQPDCGCEGKVQEVLTDQVAVYSAEKAIINVVGPQGYFYSLCNPELLEGGIADKDTVIVSGTMYANCFKHPTLIALPAHLKLTAIRKK